MPGNLAATARAACATPVTPACPNALLPHSVVTTSSASSHFFAWDSSTDQLARAASAFFTADPNSGSRLKARK
ncbi:MAG: hypothetical protein FWD68_01020 [Alphaproteobacteria bacterium]|nr:hypothetical protein [Alphaproteobacteria bacterium]